ncbi:MAG: LysR family transcriptional regulator [Synechococcaceae cyanobacterium SM2_3_2]|nr:LysR family transcriptional regulator [Synechococcaceae cyanobacterium SM2_3_2]
MELRQLHYFVTVAEELHFGRAADRLQITQPALSKQIANLEQELGVQLLARTKRTVQLTPAGQVFFEQTQQLLNQAQTAIQLTQRTDRGEVGQLTIGFTETAVHTVLPQLVRDFHQDYPNVELTLIELATEAQVMALNQNKIDLAFLHPPIDARGIELCPILEETFVAVLPQQHPLLKYDCIPLEAFANEPLIIHPRQEGPILYDGLVQVCQEAGFQPKIVKESISLQTRVCLVATGMGITFVSSQLQFLVGSNVVCRPLGKCPIRFKFAAAWRKNAASPTLQTFIKILLENLKT